MNQEVTPSAGHRRFLLVRTGNLSCALPAIDVVRVVRGLPWYPVPGARTRLLGLAQYGGEPLPIIDLHALVEGVAARTRHRATVIVGRGRRRQRSVLGLAVDEAIRVESLPEPSEEGVDDSMDGPVAGSVTVDGSPVHVVDTARLFDDGRGGTSGVIDG